MKEALVKLLETWEEAHARCVEMYRKRPNEYLDGFMSSLDLRIDELGKVLEAWEE